MAEHVRCDQAPRFLIPKSQPDQHRCLSSPGSALRARQHGEVSSLSKQNQEFPMNDETARPFLTHASGAPVTDNVNIMTAGPRGPALLQDIWLIEKLAHFHREVIPERRMHAKGAGAHGTF